MVATSSYASVVFDPPLEANLIELTYGANTIRLEVAGHRVEAIRISVAGILNIGPDAVAFVAGRQVPNDYIAQPGDRIEWMREWGSKGVGEKVWTGEEFCQFFKITKEDMQAWIVQGLKVRRCLDGSIRITETAVDEFNRVREIESPYLNTEQAAAYCNVTKDAFYGRVERKKIKPLPGSGKENLFTREQCDRMMKGEQQ